MSYDDQLFADFHDPNLEQIRDDIHTLGLLEHPEKGDAYKHFLETFIEPMIAMGKNAHGRINFGEQPLMDFQLFCSDCEIAIRKIGYGNIGEVEEGKADSAKRLKDEVSKLGKVVQIASYNIATFMAYQLGWNLYNFTYMGRNGDIKVRGRIEEEQGKIKGLVKHFASLAKPFYSIQRDGTNHFSSVPGSYYFNPGYIQEPRQEWSEVVRSLQGSNGWMVTVLDLDDDTKLHAFIDTTSKELTSLGFDLNNTKYIGGGAEQEVFAAQHESGEICRIVIKTVYDERKVSQKETTAPQMLPLITSRECETSGNKIRLDIQPMVAMPEIAKGAEYNQMTQLIQMGLIAYSRYREIQYGENPQYAYVDTSQDIALGPNRTGGKHIIPMIADQFAVESHPKKYDETIQKFQEDPNFQFPRHLENILTSNDPEFLLNPFSTIDWYRYPTGRHDEGHATIVESVMIPSALLNSVAEPTAQIIGGGAARLTESGKHMGRYGAEALPSRVPA